MGARETHRPVAALVLATSLLSLASCGHPPRETAAPPYQSIADVRETMAWILEPAADGIWGSAGTIITAEGRRELAPTTDAGWAEVRRNAILLAEAGNLLMLPGRDAGPAWVAYAQSLQATARQAQAAAEARDPDALFEAGGQIYQACVGCHAQYWVAAAGAATQE